MKLEEVNIIVGRFQPLTLGHIKGAEYVKKKYGKNTVFLMINTQANKLDSRHPFPSSDLLKMNKDISKEFDCVAGFILVSNANIMANVILLRDENFEPVLWTTGSDRLDSYKTMINRYGERIDLSKEFKVIEIPRTDDDISATNVRKSLLDDDIKTFKSLTPKTLHQFYNKLRSYMLSITESNTTYNKMYTLQEYISLKLKDTNA